VNEFTHGSRALPGRGQVARAIRGTARAFRVERVDLAGEFRRRAADSGHMANFLRDRQSRDEWNTISADHIRKMRSLKKSKAGNCDDILRSVERCRSREVVTLPCPIYKVPG
jgi:hypothetical protein